MQFRTFGKAGAGSPLDAAPPLFTGEKVIEGILGYDELGQLPITQEGPQELTLLGVAIRASV